MVTAPALWYTSKTPIDTGQRVCAYRRWAETHAGPHGTGYRLIPQRVPLATGSAVHKGLELLGGWLIDFQQVHGTGRGVLPDANELAEVLGWAASEAARKYEDKARKTGFADLADAASQAATDRLILEQRTLIEAQVWIWGTAVLPNLLGDYAVLAVESEEAKVLACTCGLGEGVSDLVAHETRGCQGIVLMGKPDWLLIHRDTQQVLYLPFKTKAQAQTAWETSWTHDLSLQIDMDAVARRTGLAVNEAYVHVLFKGWRGRDKGDPPDAPKYQHSVLCYAYFQPAVPPMREAAWATEYRWVDEEGKGHQLPKTYSKQPVWDENLPMPPVATTRAGASRVETWVTGYLKPGDWQGLVRILGPFEREKDEAQLARARDSFLAEESLWRDRVLYLRENGAVLPGCALADQVIPRSYQCTSYDNVSCPFLDAVCRRPVGEADLERFQVRTPHYRLEKQAWERVGLVFPADEDEDEEDEGGED